MQVKEKGFHQLEPRLYWNANERAIVRVLSEDPGAMIGLTVRRGDQTQNLTRTIGRGKAQVEWNTGTTTQGWDIRAYNLTGPDQVRFKIETN